MHKSRYLGLRVGQDLFNTIQKSVERSGQSQADWLRLAVSEAIERRNSLDAFESLLRESERRISESIRTQLVEALQSLEIQEEPRR